MTAPAERSLTLTLRAQPPAQIDASALVPAELAGLAPAEVARRELRCGRERVAVGDLFAVAEQEAHRPAPRSSGPALRLVGDLRSFHSIGRGMTGGVLVVDGAAGDWAGADMRGGVLIVVGSAGARLGGALPGARTGMAGGEIVVTGEAGPEAGAGMRRGLVATGGRCGAGAGVRMLAGTVVALGGIGEEAGIGNRRGSIVSGAPLEPLPGYRLAARLRPPALGLQLRRLRELGLAVGDRHMSGRWARWAGDALALNRGELLIFDDR